jgi:KDO2-lipid IV(A) lauroyltransferase
VGAKRRSRSRDLAEFVAAWFSLKILGILPRRLAVSVGIRIASCIFHLHRRLRRVGNRSLTLAFPDLPAESRDNILRATFDSLGRLLGEFSQFPKLKPESLEKVVKYRGLENYLKAAEQGLGVLLLTGHFGSWELCAFAQGMYGHPLNFLVRPLDNPYIDKMINGYRELSGNRVIDKNRAVRRVLETLKGRGDIGMLIDANTLPEEGVFCEFFGIPASCTSGLAVFALRSGAPVVPGFLIWDENKGIHELIFEPAVELVRTGDFKEEVRINTARFNKVVEDYVRRYPEQWLWIHKRWRTRPEGEPDLYVFSENAKDEPAGAGNSSATVH